MAAEEHDWQPYADAYGCKNERDLLHELYEVDELSINQIAKVLGVASFSVRRRLITHDFKLRPRGGPNRTGKRRLLEVSDEELFGSTREVLASKYQVNEGTVTLERRLRRCNTVSSVPSTGLTDSPDSQTPTSS